MALITFAAGERLTAAKLTAAFDLSRIAYQASDQTVNNSSTFVSSSSLTLSLAANSGYVYEALFIYDSPSAADFKTQLLLPSGASVRQGLWTAQTGVAATAASIAVDAFDTSPYNSGSLTGSKMTTRPVGTIATAGTAGSVTVQFAQATPTAANTILCVSSWIRLTKVL